jgi:sugar phosphate isomerase/epimerase
VRLSFNTLNHSPTFGVAACLPEQVRAAAEADYDDVGLDLGSVLAHEAAGFGPERVGALLAEHGVGCYELAVLVLSSDRAQADGALDAVLRAVRGVRPRITYAIAMEPVTAAMVAGARRAHAALADEGVALALEPVAGYGLATLGQARALAEDIGDDVGLVLDSWQLTRTGATPQEVAALPLSRIGFLQLADTAPEPEGDVAVEMANGRLLPGEGAGDAPAVCRVARAAGWDGTLSVEVLSAPWRARPPAELAVASLAAARAAWDAGAPAAPPRSGG